MKKELGKPKILLDTKPLIRFFAGEEGWDAVKRLLLRIEAGQVEAVISVVTLTEIYYKYLRENRPELAKTRTDQLRWALYLKKLPVMEDTALKAGEFKGKYGVPIADALIAATAYLDGSTIISDDPDFKRIIEVETETEKEFLS